LLPIFQHQYKNNLNFNTFLSPKKPMVGFLKKKMLSEIALRLPKLNIAGYSIGGK